MFGDKFAMLYVALRATNALFTVPENAQPAYRAALAKRGLDGHGGHVKHAARPVGKDVDITIQVPTGKSCRVEHDGVVVTVRSK